MPSNCFAPIILSKVEAPITDRGPITDFIFKSHTFLRHISMKAVDISKNCWHFYEMPIVLSPLLGVGFMLQSMTFTK
jgi:hypothetical protein